MKNQEDNITQFCESAQTGNLFKMQEAAKSGIDVSKYVDIALTEAASNGFINIVDYLLYSAELSKNAYIHYSSNRALIYACSNQHYSMIEYLIEHGADDKLNACQSFCSLVINKNKEMTEEQMKGYKKAYLALLPYVKTEMSQDSLLEDAMYRWAKKHYDFGILQYIIEKNLVTVSSINDYLYPFMVLAVEGDNIDLFNYLLENGANLPINNENIMNIAAKNDSVNAFHQIVKKGFNIFDKANHKLNVPFKTQPNNNTNELFHIALKNNSVNVMRYILRLEYQQERNGFDIKFPINKQDVLLAGFSLHNYDHDELHEYDYFTIRYIQIINDMIKYGLKLNEYPTIFHYIEKECYDLCDNSSKGMDMMQATWLNHITSMLLEHKMDFSLDTKGVMIKLFALSNNYDLLKKVLSSGANMDYFLKRYENLEQWLNNTKYQEKIDSDIPLDDINEFFHKNNKLTPKMEAWCKNYHELQSSIK